MKIIAIRLKNLTSIEGSVEVDFSKEPLRSAGIFAISGATGAGKSTLLDALCLALYDKAPRFANSVESINLADVGENQISQSDVRNLLRRGTSDGYAEVDFVGMNGHCYRSRWSVRRTRNKADGSLRTQTLELKDLDTEKEFQGTRKELLARLVELVGLTYEQFTRTVLLAQNDFATFLKSKGAAKAELLEKLTGTSIYSQISQEVFVRNKVAQEEVALIRNRMEMIELLPAEEIVLLQEEKEKLAEQRMAGINILADMNAQLNTVHLLQAQEVALKGKLQEEQTAQNRLQALKDAQTTQEKELEQFRKQWEAIQPDLKKARQLDIQIQLQQESYGQSLQALQTVSHQVEEQKKRLSTDRTQLGKAYAVLNSLLGGEADASFDNLRQAESFLQKEEEGFRQVSDRHEACRLQLIAFNYQALVDEQSRLQKERERRKNVQQKTDELQQTRKEIDTYEKESQLVFQQLQAQEVALNTVQRLYENTRMAVGRDVQQMRQYLRSGEACPVCGSTVHPYCGEEAIVDTLFRQMEQEYNAASTAYQQSNNRNISLQRDLSHLQKSEQQLMSQLALLQKEGLDDRDDSHLLYRLEELAASIQEYHRLYAEWQRMEEEVKRLRIRCERLREAVSTSRLAMQKVASGSEQLSLLEGTYQSEKKRNDSLAGVLEELRKERSLLLKGKSADEAEAVVCKREREMNAALEKARKDVEVVKGHLSELQGEKKQLVASVEELRNRQKDIQAPEQLPEAIRQQQEANMATERTLSGIEARLLQYSKNKQQMDSMTVELAEKLAIADRWAKLNKLLGSADGTKFKVIAQSYTLELLLRHANRHLSYLSRRYKLQQVPGTLALQVIDCDMCDEVRTVYSLSGGESFLISLALALGLSSLSSNNLRVESLFIDEGFGSLDADSLRTAMEALEQLQMQGRKIGVISHVQEMSERIAVQIRVNKKANGKSALTVVG